ncbi:hypothetical protein DFH29DRAFT_874270 [Suillus ampliporus]|nr:hypothetical protein DFH29DRAFT_874270 [Suillus ampliporus]
MADGPGEILLPIEMGWPIWVMCRIGWTYMIDSWAEERCIANIIILTGGPMYDGWAEGAVEIFIIYTGGPTWGILDRQIDVWAESAVKYLLHRRTGGPRQGFAFHFCAGFELYCCNLEVIHDPTTSVASVWYPELTNACSTSAAALRQVATSDAPM